MSDETERFITNGKITNPSFFERGADTMVYGGGITSGFSKVLGEQVFMPVKQPKTPFYQAFAGRPMIAGTSWMERLIMRKASKRYNPKASADDALGFEDSSGMEKVFAIDFEGWRKVTIPSNLVTTEMFNPSAPEKVAELNSILVDSTLKDYQEEMNDAVMVKAMTTCQRTGIVDVTDTTKLRDYIRDKATEMMGTKVNYSNLSDDDYKKYRLGADSVLCFIDAKIYNKMVSDFAELPSPDKLVQNCTMIPVVDGLEAIMISGEFADAKSTFGWTTELTDVLTMDDGSVPVMFMCSSKRVEVRPFIEEYRMNLDKNGAGDFTNVQIIYKGAIGIRNWENAIVVFAQTPAVGNTIKVQMVDGNGETFTPTFNVGIDDDNWDGLKESIVPEG